MDPTPDRTIADMSGVAALPRKNGELVFDEAWQGRIFGMTVAMSHEARFAWGEFQAQLIAEAAGKPVLIPPEMARLTQTQVGSANAGWFSFQPLWARITREQPDLLE